MYFKYINTQSISNTFLNTFIFVHILKDFKENQYLYQFFISFYEIAASHRYNLHWKHNLK